MAAKLDISAGPSLYQYSCTCTCTWYSILLLAPGTGGSTIVPYRYILDDLPVVPSGTRSSQIYTQQEFLGTGTANFVCIMGTNTMEDVHVYLRYPEVRYSCITATIVQRQSYYRYMYRMVVLVVRCTCSTCTGMGTGTGRTSSGRRYYSSIYSYSTSQIQYIV